MVHVHVFCHGPDRAVGAYYVEKKQPLSEDDLLQNVQDNHMGISAIWRVLKDLVPAHEPEPEHWSVSPLSRDYVYLWAPFHTEFSP